MKCRNFKFQTAAVSMLLSLILAAPLLAQDFGGEPDPEAFEKPSYSPFAGRIFR